jgi:hypothetical protein
MPLVTQIGLMDTTGHIDTHLMQTVAAALNLQVTRDLPQYWPVHATVIYLANPRSVPAGVWPVQLVSHLPPGEGGFHLTKHNQPYAKVLVAPGSDGWTIAASHEVSEMLVDPSGNRLQASIAIEVVNGQIQDGTGQFEYLVEACDPCEADNYAYTIQGVAVSDFLTPHFYDPMLTQGTRYSFTGALKKPREILPGGYISWINPAAEEVQQLQYVDPNQPPTIVNLGPASGASLREFIDSKSRPTVALSNMRGDHPVLEAARRYRASRDEAALRRARHYE